MKQYKQLIINWLVWLLIGIGLVGCGGVRQANNWPGLTIEDNMIYLSYGVGVAVFDIETGQQLWHFPTETNPALMFFTAPIVDDERVILGDYGASGGLLSSGTTISLYALNKKDGQELWKNEELLTDRMVAMPAQDSQMVYLGTNDDFVYALDPVTGTPKWHYEVEHSIYGQPIVADETIYIVSLDKYVYALNASNGEEIWKTELDGSIMNAPAIDENALYISSFNHHLYKVDRATGGILWIFNTDGWLWAGATVYDGVVYVGDLDSTLYAIDVETGKEFWSISLPELGSVQAKPLVKNDTIYFVMGIVDADPDQENAGTVLALDTNGTEKWRVTVNGPIFTPPVLANNSIVVVPITEEYAVHFYNLESGEQSSPSLIPRTE